MHYAKQVIILVKLFSRKEANFWKNLEKCVLKKFSKKHLFLINKKPQMYHQLATSLNKCVMVLI